MFYNSIELASLLLVILTCVSAKEIPKEKPTSLESLLKKIEHLEKEVESLKDGNSQSKFHFKFLLYFSPHVNYISTGPCTIDQIKKLASNMATFQLCFSLFSFSAKEAQTLLTVSDVAFYAYLTENTNIEPNQVVIFDNVVTNVGNAYSTSTGTFRGKL